MISSLASSSQIVGPNIFTNEYTRLSIILSPPFGLYFAFLKRSQRLGRVKGVLGGEGVFFEMENIAIRVVRLSCSMHGLRLSRPQKNEIYFIFFGKKRDDRVKTVSVFTSPRLW